MNKATPAPKTGTGSWLHHRLPSSLILTVSCPNHQQKHFQPLPLPGLALLGALPAVLSWFKVHLAHSHPGAALCFLDPQSPVSNPGPSSIHRVEMLVPGYVLPAHLPTEETETPLATSALGLLPGSSAPPPDHELGACASSPRSAQDMPAPPLPPLLMEPPRSLAAPVLCLPGDWGLWEQPAPQQQQLLQPTGLWAWPPPFLPPLLPRVFENNVCVCKSCQWGLCWLCCKGTAGLPKELFSRRFGCPQASLVASFPSTRNDEGPGSGEDPGCRFWLLAGMPLGDEDVADSRRNLEICCHCPCSSPAPRCHLSRMSLLHPNV